MLIKLDVYFWAVIICHSLVLPYQSVKINLSRKLQAMLFLVEDHEPGHWFAVRYLTGGIQATYRQLDQSWSLSLALKSKERDKHFESISSKTDGQNRWDRSHSESDLVSTDYRGNRTVDYFIFRCVLHRPASRDKGIPALMRRSS